MVPQFKELSTISLKLFERSLIEKLGESHQRAAKGMQAIIESVAAAKRVHLIDLEIRTGEQCMLLMQALATQHEPQVKLLTITGSWNNIEA
ncbi:hypothetical protein Patl1_24908 [Pistacia atlantica]|uniref:Uncharacterized protein n=1 Tax=Pistacia atlantica TaxID=434234 RepID=A0ACC1B3D8_9ROSI|nr:hypothetical protein Patl1_24908 [Pistacia atlantica]